MIKVLRKYLTFGAGQSIPPYHRRNSGNPVDTNITPYIGGLLTGFLVLVSN